MTSASPPRFDQPFRRNTICQTLRREGPAVLFLTAAAALFFWPLWVAGYRFPKGSGDLWGAWYPVWSFVAEWLRRGVFSLWDYRMMGGDPIFSDVQYGLLNPLNWPLFLVFPIPHWMVLLRGVLPLWLAGTGLYLYLRHSPVWRLRRVPALAGATAYMLSDPFIITLGNPPFNDAKAWLPWILLGVDLAAHRTRRIPMAALPVVLLFTSGHGEISLYVCTVAGLYATWQMIEGGWPDGLRRAGRLLLGGLLGIALSAPVLLPGIERLPFTDRTGVPWELRRGYEFLPAMLVDFLSPAFHGRGVDQFWPSWARIGSGYIGAVALYLTLPGILGNLRRRRTWFLLGISILAYALAILAAQGIEYLQSDRRRFAPLLAFLHADPGWFRIDVDPAARGLWPPVFLQMEGFEVPQGMGNAMDLREFSILRWRTPSATHPAYRMLGVKYIIVPKGAPPGGEGIWPVFVDDPNVDIHLNTLALPRAWLVYRTEKVESYGQALERVLDPNFRPEEVAVIQNGPQLDGTGRGRIEVGYYGPNDVVFFVETDAPALLVLSDTFYPGWQATVDGHRVPIYQTNAAFRGVVVPPGRHRVEMHFRPQSLMLGLGMAMAGGLGCLALGLMRRRYP